MLVHYRFNASLTESDSYMLVDYKVGSDIVRYFILADDRFKAVYCLLFIF